MNRISIGELNQRSVEDLPSGEALVVEQAGKLVGVYVPVKVASENEGRAAVERIGHAVNEALAEGKRRSNNETERNAPPPRPGNLHLLPKTEEEARARAEEMVRSFDHIRRTYRPTLGGVKLRREDAYEDRERKLGLR